MGRWVEWTITADLTDAEIRRIVSTHQDRIVPALKALSSRSVWKAGVPRTIAMRIVSRSIRQTNRRYATTAGAFATGPDGFVIAPLHTLQPATIGFRAGDGACQTLGFQDYAVLAALALVASESCKLAMTAGDDLDRNRVRSVVADVAAASGYIFRNVDALVGRLPPSDAEDEKPEP